MKKISLSLKGTNEGIQSNKLNKERTNKNRKFKNWEDEDVLNATDDIEEVKLQKPINDKKISQEIDAFEYDAVYDEIKKKRKEEQEKYEEEQRRRKETTLHVCKKLEYYIYIPCLYILSIYR